MRKSQKMKPQEILLKKIRNNIKPTTSLNEVISNILNISYDAAHRRVSLKSKFSIDETITLCNHYGISMDSLFQESSKVLMERTPKIKNQSDFKNYFELSAQHLAPFKKLEKTIHYLAKDLPIHYAISGGELAKFKKYIWYTLLSQETFTNYAHFHLSDNVTNATNNVQDIFSNSVRIEIWNDTTINSTLQQIVYFFESGLLDFSLAKALLEEVTQIIKHIEKKCNEDPTDFKLYYNELLILNNTVLVDAKNKMAFFLPYNLLGYYVTNDSQTCLEEKEYIKLQLANSKLLNTAGKKDKQLFFQKMYQKIEFQKLKIDNFIIE